MKDLVHQDSFGFFLQKNIYNYLKVGALHWPWKGIALKYSQVNFGKYLGVTGCIGMFIDELLNFFPSSVFVPWNKISCNLSIYFSALVRPMQAAHFPLLLGPTDPTTREEHVEFETFWATHCGLSPWLVFLQIGTLPLSFDGEKHHSRLMERACTLKFFTIARSSSLYSVVLATSTILFITVSFLIISWQLYRCCTPIRL